MFARQVLFKLSHLPVLGEKCVLQIKPKVIPLGSKEHNWLPFWASCKSPFFLFLSFFEILIFNVMHTGVLPSCMPMRPGHVVPTEARRGSRILWNWKCTRATSALSLCAISPPSSSQPLINAKTEQGCGCLTSVIAYKCRQLDPYKHLFKGRHISQTVSRELNVIIA